MASRVHREVKPRTVECMCGQSTCGVGKATQQMQQNFYAKFGDTPDIHAVDRRVRAMVPAFYGHQGR